MTLQERRVYDALYDAVAKWVKFRGGEAVLATGVEIRGEFRVAIRITGRKPALDQP